MESSVLNTVKNTLLLQKELFGDELYSVIEFNTDEIISEHKEIVVSEKKEQYSDNLTEQKMISSLDDFYNSIKKCQKCELHKSRKNFVFGVGNPNAKLMLIGEAPGAEEDLQGIPFVGRAGKLLTDILKAINFERDEVYIANILKCRPPNNRDPLPTERETCFPYLDKQIELIKPKLILCLGRIAANTLLGKNEPMSLLRGGNKFMFRNIPVMVTYHPAALLRNPNWKKGCWEDVQLVRKLYDQLES